MNGDKRDPLSFLQDDESKLDVVVGWHPGGSTLPDNLQAVWRSWSNEDDGEGCRDSVGEDFGPGQVGAVVILFANILLFAILYFSYAR